MGIIYKQTAAYLEDLELIPKYFSDVQRGELLTFLKNKRLGNDSSRDKFISDVEEWLGLYGMKTTGRDAIEIKMQLIDVKKNSENLLKQLDKNYPDTDAWIIDGITAIKSRISYKLNKLTYEEIKEYLTLLRGSCEWALDAINPKRQYRFPGKDREFISQVADCYKLRFHKKPSPSRNSTFQQVIDKIAKLSGFEIPIGEKFLKTILLLK